MTDRAQHNLQQEIKENMEIREVVQDMVSRLEIDSKKPSPYTEDLKQRLQCRQEDLRNLDQRIAQLKGELDKVRQQK